MRDVSDPVFRQRGARKRWEVRFWTFDGMARRRVFKGGLPSKTAARAWFDDYRARFKSGALEVIPAKSLGEFLELFHAEGSTGKGERSIQRDRAAVKAFKAFLKESTPLTAISSADVDRYIHHREAAGRSAATINRELATFSRMFNVALRWGLMESNPAAGRKKLRVPEGDVVFLELDEQRKLLSACSLLDDEARHNSRNEAPYLFPLVALALSTGLRKAELLNLRWNQVDLDNRKVIVKNTDTFRTKSRRNRGLHLNDCALQELKRWREWFREECGRAMDRSRDEGLSLQLRRKAEARLAVLKRCEPRPERLVFPSFRGVDEQGEALPMDNVQSSWESALQSAFGVESGRVRADGTPEVILPVRYRIGLHALRHTFAVMAARANAPMAKLARAMGHASIRTTEVYLRFYPDEGAEVTKALPDPRARVAILWPNEAKAVG